MRIKGIMLRSVSETDCATLGRFPACWREMEAARLHASPFAFRRSWPVQLATFIQRPLSLIRSNTSQDMIWEWTIRICAKTRPWDIPNFLKMRQHHRAVTRFFGCRKSFYMLLDDKGKFYCKLHHKLHYTITAVLSRCTSAEDVAKKRVVYRHRCRPTSINRLENKLAVMEIQVHAHTFSSTWVSHWCSVVVPPFQAIACCEPNSAIQMCMTGERIPQRDACSISQDTAKIRYLNLVVDTPCTHSILALLSNPADNLLNEPISNKR